MSEPIKQTIDTTAVTLLNSITGTITGFATFEELITAKGGYRPSISSSKTHPLAILNDYLAISYDQAQELRGDERRAYRS